MIVTLPSGIQRNGSHDTCSDTEYMLMFPFLTYLYSNFIIRNKIYQNDIKAVKDVPHFGQVMEQTAP